MSKDLFRDTYILTAMHMYMYIYSLVAYLYYLYAESANIRPKFKSKQTKKFSLWGNKKHKSKPYVSETIELIYVPLYHCYWHYHGQYISTGS